VRRPDSGVHDLARAAARGWEPDGRYRSALVFSLSRAAGRWVRGVRAGVGAETRGDGFHPHLTLLFLGECDGRCLATAARWLADFPWPPLRVAPDGFGTFGDEAAVRTLYVSIRRDGPLIALHRALLAAVREQPWFRLQTQFAGDRFVPHVTIADELALPPSELRLPPFDLPARHLRLRAPRLMVTALDVPARDLCAAGPASPPRARGRGSHPPISRSHSHAR
jgi:2'-5' RNA ligase